MSPHRGQPGYKRTLKAEPYTQDEIERLVSDEKKRKKEETRAWVQIAARFKK